ncbi:MAG: transcriptional regulator, TrmB [Candidatus Saccharibacteria bacterium]|nr:transcriptional regulator, TrmB [Candidatus Saccharibacteria bacterium]
MSNDISNIVSLLQSIEVPRTEAVTYAALLDMESTSIRKIAAVTGINRGTTYEALKNLVEFGLVSVKQNGQREQYTAESPEKIYDIIRDKRRDLADASNLAKEVVPSVLARKAGEQGKPLVRYYEGDVGVTTILKDVLQTCRMMDKPQYYAYSSQKVRQYLYRKYPQFTDRRIAEGIKVKVIAVGEGGGETPKSERKWLPNPPQGGVSSYTLIYGSKVATISIASDDTPYGVVIEDNGAAAMQRLLFRQLWKTLPAEQPAEK